jgi:acyl-CoA thioester hydrolase
MGYVHHSAYLIFLEMGRTELLRTSGTAYRDLEEMGVYFVVTRVDLRFRRPARYDDSLIVTTSVDRMTRARIDHRYQISRDRIQLVEGVTTIACVGRDGKPREIPDSLRIAPTSRNGE